MYNVQNLMGMLGSQPYFLLFWNIGDAVSGSWHYSRRRCCPYCSAVQFLEPGEPEGLLYTSFGPDTEHRKEPSGLMKHVLKS